MIKSKLRLFGWAVGLSLALGAVGAVASIAQFEVSPTVTKAAAGDIHDMEITQSTVLNNNAEIPSINISSLPYSINKVTLNVRYNKSLNPGVTIAVSVGGTSWGTLGVAGTGSNYVDKEFSGIATTGDISITFTNHSGSGTGKGTFWIASVTVTEAAPVVTPTIAPSSNGSMAVTDSKKDITLTAKNFGEESVTYSITSAPTSSIATAAISGNTLTLTPAGVGVTSVTVRGASASYSATLAIEITVANPSVSVIKNSLNSLKIGSYITFGNPTKSEAISKTATSGYRNSESVTISSGSFTPGSNVSLFKLGLGTAKDTFTFYESFVATGGYLYTPGSSYGLSTQASIDAKSSFTLGTPSSTGLVDIASGANSQNYIRVYTKSSVDYFQGSSMSSGAGVAIYQYDCGESLSDAAISVTGTPTKTEYTSGESFDPTGLTVTATLKGDAYNVTNWVDWSNCIVSAGDTSVTGSISVLGQSADVPYAGITVEAASISEISIGTLPKVAYDYNETLDLSGLVVNGTAQGISTPLNVTADCVLYYDYGTDSQAEVVDGVNLTSVGTKTITVVYGDGSTVAPASFNITVNPALTLDKSQLSLNEIGAKATITASAHFESQPTITAVSSVPGVASVGVSGNIITVTAVASGNSTITVTAQQGTKQLNATCVVTVKAVPSTAVFTWESLSLSGSYSSEDEFEDNSGYAMGWTNLLKGSASSTSVLQMRKDGTGELHNVTPWKSNISTISVAGPTNVTVSNMILKVGAASDAVSTTIGGRLASNGTTVLFDVSGASGTNEFKYFSLSTGSSYAQIDAIKVTAASDEATAFAASFNTAIASECAAKNVVSDTWTAQTNAYGDLSKAAKNIFVNTSIPAEPTEQQVAAFTEVEHAVSRHDFIVKKYAAYDDFMGRGVVTAGLGAKSILTSGLEKNAIVFVAAFAGVGALAVGGMVFLRKRKEL